MSITKDTITTNDNAANPLKNVSAIKPLVRRFNVSRSTAGAIQITLRTTAGTGLRGVWYVKRSLDGVDFADFSTPVAITTGSGTVISGDMDLTTTQFIELGLTTPSTYDAEVVDIVLLRSDRWA